MEWKLIVEHTFVHECVSEGFGLGWYTCCTFLCTFQHVPSARAPPVKRFCLFFVKLVNRTKTYIFVSIWYQGLIIRVVCDKANYDLFK